MRHTWLAALAAQAALAASPVLTELQPRGAEIGQPFTLTLVGRNLGEDARISSPLAASFTMLTPSQSARNAGMMGPGRSVSFLVEPKADVAPGVYPVRMRDAPGNLEYPAVHAGDFS